MVEYLCRLTLNRQLAQQAQDGFHASFSVKKLVFVYAYSSICFWP